MSRGWVAALLASALVALAAAPAKAELGEPVVITPSAPEVVAPNSPFRLQVDVAAEPGALDIAAQPLRLRVRLAPECGGSFAGSEGPTAIDRELPAPHPGKAYETSVATSVKLSAAGTETVCAFLEDADERQFATDVETTVTVAPGCTPASRKLAQLRHRLTHTRKQLSRLQRRRRHAHGKARHALGHRIVTLRRKQHALRVRLRKAKQVARVACKAGGSASGAAASSATTSPAAGVPKINHLFIITLENEDAAETFGPESPAPYLGKTLPAAGAFFPNYYGIGHQSLDNYIAMVSGQPPNIATQSDCQTFSEMLPGTVREDGVAVGQGCVFPTTVRTVANQLENSGQSWRGYMQDMANSVAAGEPASCRHPALNAIDPTQKARAGDQYAARHNPFVYFHSIIDYSTCQRNDVDLNQLPQDLAAESTTPDYSFITPDLCADGHDATCADESLPGGFAGIEAFLREWVPRIQASAAYRDQGAILITFDESENGAESCCGETTGPNTPNNGGVTPGPGGGKVGAVMLSPCIRPGTVTDTPYNHYSLLRWTEDNFGLAHLANAGAEGLQSFGNDVFTRPSCDPEIATAEARAAAKTRLKVRPRRVPLGKARVLHFRLVSELRDCRAGAVIRFAGRRLKTDAKGRARVKVRLRHRGTHVAIARPSGCRAARARVSVKPRR